MILNDIQGGGIVYPIGMIHNNFKEAYLAMLYTKQQV
jgi:hypothetical protein